MTTPPNDDDLITCDGRPYSPDGDDHPYIERKKIR